MSDTRSELLAKRRTALTASERQRLERANALIVDGRRARPHYQDGRFLAARDLIADQEYVAWRQADLGRAAGWGVVSGLTVTRDSERATRVRIQAGHAVTPGGEPVVLAKTTDVDLYDVRRSIQLDAHLGLRRDRTRRSRQRTGAFVLALRPVEYTADPKRGYPTSLHGKRELHDHAIVEATAITLVPWPGIASASPAQVRRQLTRDIFVSGTGRGLPSDLVPLAVVYLDGVGVDWVDPWLVRRPVGSEQADLLGLGLVDRGVREAHVRQYADHLDYVLRGGSTGLEAAEHFDVLPPVGTLPAASITTASFSQGFFPPAIDVDLSFVPEDELGSVVEESLLLPPIDLTASTEVLAAVSLLVLVPVPRSRLRRFREQLGSVRRRLTRRSLMSAGVRTPQMALSRLRLPTIRAIVDDSTPSTTEHAAWVEMFETAREDLGSDGMLWYARRRNLNYRSEIQGYVVDIDAS